MIETINSFQFESLINQIKMACQSEMNDLKYCREMIRMQSESEFSIFPTDLRVLVTCYPFQQKYASCLASEAGREKEKTKSCNEQKNVN